MLSVHHLVDGRPVQVAPRAGQLPAEGRRLLGRHHPQVLHRRGRHVHRVGHIVALARVREKRQAVCAAVPRLLDERPWRDPQLALLDAVAPLARLQRLQPHRRAARVLLRAAGGHIPELRPRDLQVLPQRRVDAGEHHQLSKAAGGDPVHQLRRKQPLAAHHRRRALLQHKHAAVRAVQLHLHRQLAGAGGAVGVVAHGGQHVL
mmetsp:Transcript_13676/g.34450  ORF Transcript_13676/g.34450 Transcript_13676/m.34450 type:complete len:204 (+) Transcript_13676:346-957(+)